MNAPELVRHFGMSPHPEGGFYRETYRSAGSIPAEALPSAFSGARSYSTAILFLLRQGDVSRLHRIRQDELWHFYLGDPLRLVMISPEGRPEEVVLGQDVTRGQHLQWAVPAGYWFGAAPAPESAFSLIGCTVAPGFDFADFELGEREALLRLFPDARELVERFG